MTAVGCIPTKQPDRITYSKNGSPSIVQEWKGPIGLMNGLVANLRVGYDEVTMETRDGVVTVRGFNRRPIGYETEQPVINFDLVSESQTVGLAYHSRYVGLSDAVISAVENGFNDSSKTLTEKQALITAANGDVASSLGNELLATKLRGQDSYQDYSWAFTRTTSVSRYYPIAIDLTDHGKLWTNAQVNSYVGSLPLFSLPSTSETTDQQNNGLYYRWLRYQSQVQLNSAGNFNLTEGWRLALWNTRTYSAK